MNKKLVESMLTNEIGGNNMSPVSFEGTRNNRIVHMSPITMR